MIIDKNVLLAHLRKQVMDITFEKKSDGSMRTMKCTLLPSYLPQLTEEQNEKKNNINPQETTLTNIIKVWEVNVGWRSFDLKDVVDVQFASTN